MWDTPVLVRGGGTTTYHFGLETPICEKRPSVRETEPAVMTLEAAVKAQKRLCEYCAGYLGSWAAAGLLPSAKRGLVNPSK